MPIGHRYLLPKCKNKFSGEFVLEKLYIVLKYTCEFTH